MFDTQLMADAEVSAEEYQRGSLLGWQLRGYVFHRDGRRWVYCEREDDNRELRGIGNTHVQSLLEV